MKTANILLAIIILFVVFTNNYSQNIFVETSIAYVAPVGSLSERFKPAYDFAITLGREQKNKKLISFKFDYINYYKVNKNIYKLKKVYDVSGSSQTYIINIKEYDMNMKIAAGSIEWGLPLVQMNNFATYTSIGAGIYYWDFNRAPFKDSIYVSVNDSVSAFAEFIDVPKLRQTDWNGGFNLGLKSYYYFMPSFGIMICFDYRLIIAEMWPTLKINLENVSGFQTLETKIGLLYRF